jgi:hypothetical protein
MGCSKDLDQHRRQGLRRNVMALSFQELSAGIGNGGQRICRRGEAFGLTQRRLRSRFAYQLTAGTTPSGTASIGDSGINSSVASTLSHASAATVSIRATGISARS